MKNFKNVNKLKKIKFYFIFANFQTLISDSETRRKIAVLLKNFQNLKKFKKFKIFFIFDKLSNSDSDSQTKAKIMVLIKNLKIYNILLTFLFLRILKFSPRIWKLDENYGTDHPKFEGSRILRNGDPSDWKIKFLHELIDNFPILCIFWS